MLSFLLYSSDYHVSRHFKVSYDYDNNHPEWFQIEAPKENRSHKHEKKKRKAGYKK